MLGVPHEHTYQPHLPAAILDNGVDCNQLRSRRLAPEAVASCSISIGCDGTWRACPLQVQNATAEIHDIHRSRGVQKNVKRQRCARFPQPSLSQQLHAPGWHLALRRFLQDGRRSVGQIVQAIHSAILRAIASDDLVDAVPRRIEAARFSGARRLPASGTTLFWGSSQSQWVNALHLKHTCIFIASPHHRPERVPSCLIFRSSEPNRDWATHSRRDAP